MSVHAWPGYLLFILKVPLFVYLRGLALAENRLASLLKGGLVVFIQVVEGRVRGWVYFHLLFCWKHESLVFRHAEVLRVFLHRVDQVLANQFVLRVLAGAGQSFAPFQRLFVVHQAACHRILHAR